MLWLIRSKIESGNMIELELTEHRNWGQLEIFNNAKTFGVDHFMGLLLFVVVTLKEL